MVKTDVAEDGFDRMNSKRTKIKAARRIGRRHQYHARDASD